MTRRGRVVGKKNKKNDDAPKDSWKIMDPDFDNIEIEELDLREQYRGRGADND
jgi:hypothetical protein